MNDFVNHKFRLVMLPLATPDPKNAWYYQRALHCWETVWRGFFDQLQIGQPFFIDNFLRQDEAACIFTDSTCVALIMFRTVDFSIMDYKNDSWFKVWSEADLEMLFRHGRKVFVASNLTVHPDFRRYSPEVKFKEIILDIMVQRFFEGGADVISGITRRDRGIHDESYKLGASMVRENVEYLEGRARVDLVAFFRDEAHVSESPNVRAMSDALWKNRMDLSSKPCGQ
jgi:hypothetical protein